ncbi:hypothetical protein B14911_24120 [Bacillus sp. NRRL B-14911]|nr:hypothetical protein B14911_24120 [Bacillus sp. NRRL B-14911]
MFHGDISITDIRREIMADHSHIELIGNFALLKSAVEFGLIQLDNYLPVFQHSSKACKLLPQTNSPKSIK